MEHMLPFLGFMELQFASGVQAAHKSGIARLFCFVLFYLRATCWHLNSVLLDVYNAEEI